ncbi:MAG: PilZ domain-containing protein [Anaerolineales bacterium]|nr:PilZ domain-containing protein [Anaerolineales bacterium]
MKERRTKNRKEISFYICILENSSGQMIGHLVNISPTGLRIDSHLSIPAGQEFVIRIELTDTIGGEAYLILKTRTVWSRPDRIEPNFYNIGLEIFDPTPEQVQVIETIAKQFGKYEPPSIPTR